MLLMSVWAKEVSRVFLFYLLEGLFKPKERSGGCGGLFCCWNGGRDEESVPVSAEVQEVGQYARNNLL